jgi:hypothetical protein
MLLWWKRGIILATAYMGIKVSLHRFLNAVSDGAEWSASHSGKKTLKV